MMRVARINFPFLFEDLIFFSNLTAMRRVSFFRSYLWYLNFTSIV